VTSGDLLRIIEEAPVVKLTNMIISQAVKERSSDILIEPMERNFRVRYRIDGILHIRHTPPKKYLRALISRLKVMSNLNIAETRLPQDGRFKLRIEDRRIDFRVSVVPSILGEKANLRILDKEEVTINIDLLGLKKRDRDVICQASEVPNGMILACGPTGSGKTTTLYSVLKYVDSSEKNLVTAEDPIEYQLGGINQVSINPAIGLTFAGCLRSILRQDPDVIMVGEIRDFETVDIAIKSALTGHLVLSTLHTNTACGAIVRLMNMGVEPYLVASSVVLIIAQRLVRKLCPECKEAYTVPREVAEKYGIFDPKGGIPQIYKPRSCKRCRNTGYMGRTVIAECLRITATIRDLLCRDVQEFEIEKAGRKEGMITLRQNGIENVIDGTTSLEEVLHVTAETKEMVG
jgi:type IV pilus assembly protein PilB